MTIFVDAARLCQVARTLDVVTALRCTDLPRTCNAEGLMACDGGMTA